jgi:RNA polymerase sigma-70 factor (ECF subfamily)
MEAQWLDELYASHRATIYRLCLSRLRDPVDAEDATQEVFARALARGMGDIKQPEAWLVTAARNICVDYGRHESRGRKLEEKAIRLAEGDGPGADGIVASRALIADLLARLTPSERTVLVRSVLIDQSHAEVGTALGIEASTSRVLLSRACRRLRAYLQENGELLGAWVLGRLVPGARRRKDSLRRGPDLADRGLAAAIPLAIATAIAISGGPQAGGRLDLPTPSASGQGSGWVQALTGYGGGDPELTQAPIGAIAGAPGTKAGNLKANHGTGPLAALLIPPPSQKDVTVLDIAASPEYGSDQTVLEIGTVNGCSPPPCYAAFRSRDSGHSWTYLAGRGLSASQLILPPGAIGSGRFFAFGPVGLQVTNDGGMTFTTISPRLPGFAAASSPGSRYQVIVSNLAAEGYNQSVRPGFMYNLGPGWEAAGPPLVGNDGEPALQPADEIADTSGGVQLLRCVARCTSSVPLPWAGPTALVRSPAYELDRVIVAVSTLRDIAVSKDAGQTFQARTLATGVAVESLALVPMSGHPRMVVLSAASSNVATLISDDDGMSWQAPSRPPTDRGFRPSIVRWLDGLHLIESGTEGSPEVWSGFRCSADGGSSWGSC